MSSQKKSFSDASIVIRGNTYKRSFVKYVRNLCYFVAILSLLMIPIMPLFIVLALFFIFVGKQYSKALNNSNDTTSSKHIEPQNHRDQPTEATNTLFNSSITYSKTPSVSNLRIPSLTFKVAGVTFENDSKKNVQTIIKSIVKEIRESNDKDYFYEGKSNAEIKELLEFDSDEKIFELNYETIDDISFVPEPDNKFDPNAIKVVSAEYGHLGYVPKAAIKAAKELLDKSNLNINCTITGGKYKYYDEDEDKVLTDSWDYGLEVDVM